MSTSSKKTSYLIVARSTIPKDCLQAKGTSIKARIDKPRSKKPKLNGKNIRVNT